MIIDPHQKQKSVTLDSLIDSLESEVRIIKDIINRYPDVKLFIDGISGPYKYSCRCANQLVEEVTLYDDVFNDALMARAWFVDINTSINIYTDPVDLCIGSLNFLGDITIEHVKKNWRNRYGINNASLYEDLDYLIQKRKRRVYDNSDEGGVQEKNPEDDA